MVIRVIIVTIIFLNSFSNLWAQSSFSKNIEESLIEAQELSQSNLDSAVYILQNALQKAQSVDSHRLAFLTQRAIGFVFEDNNRLKDAQKAYESALKLAEKYLSDDDQLMIYTDWAIIHKKLGQYNIAREYHLLTIQRAEKMGNWEMVEDGYHGLGTMYSMMSNFNQSIYYYLQSIKAAEKWNNNAGIVLTEQNISNIYLKSENYEMALKNIEKTYDLALKLGDSVRIAAVLKIYGNIKMAIGDYQDALSKHFKAKAIFVQKGDKVRLAESFMCIADSYSHLKDFTKANVYFDSCAALSSFLPPYSHAEFYLKRGQLFESEEKTAKSIDSYKQAIALTDKLGFKEIARNAHLALGQIFSKKKQYEVAFSHMMVADSLEVLLAKEASQKNMTELQFKFDIEKRDFEIENQKKALAYSQRIRYLLGGGFIILSILLFFAWRQMTAKQKAMKRIELLMKELNHRVKNNIQTIASMMRLQARQNNDPSVSAVLLENKSRLETFSLIHQQLYRTDNLEFVNLQPFVENILGKLKFAYGIPDDKLITHLKVANQGLNIESSLPIGLIINELITNSFKYAYPSVSPLEITIEICSQALHYADNGKSLSPNFDFEKNAGFGVKMIISFAQQIKSKYKFSQDNGFRFDMTFGM